MVGSCMFGWAFAVEVNPKLASENKKITIIINVNLSFNFW
jgi:hypothetical protein